MALALAALALLLRSSCVVAGSPERQSVLLDGSGWHLELDPSDAATKRIAAAGNKTSGPIVVPAAWQAQGFGEETHTMRFQYIGVATYTRSVDVPAGFEGPGKTLWIVAERIERSAKLLVGEKLVTEHTGYLSKLEGEVTGLTAGGKLALTMPVNATRKRFPGASFI